jgi:hypothetical protein
LFLLAIVRLILPFIGRDNPSPIEDIAGVRIVAFLSNAFHQYFAVFGAGISR